MLHNVVVCCESCRKCSSLLNANVLLHNATMCALYVLTGQRLAPVNHQQAPFVVACSERSLAPNACCMALASLHVQSLVTTDKDVQALKVSHAGSLKLVALHRDDSFIQARSAMLPL